MKYESRWEIILQLNIENDRKGTNFYVLTAHYLIMKIWDKMLLSIHVSSDGKSCLDLEGVLVRRGGRGSKNPKFLQKSLRKAPFGIAAATKNAKRT